MTNFFVDKGKWLSILIFTVGAKQKLNSPIKRTTMMTWSDRIGFTSIGLVFGGVYLFSVYMFDPAVVPHAANWPGWVGGGSTVLGIIGLLMTRNN